MIGLGLGLGWRFGLGSGLRLRLKSESESGLGLELGCIKYIKLLIQYIKLSIQYTINWVAFGYWTYCVWYKFSEFFPCVWNLWTYRTRVRSSKYTGWYWIVSEHAAEPGTRNPQNAHNSQRTTHPQYYAPSKDWTCILLSNIKELLNIKFMMWLKRCMYSILWM